MFEDLEPLSTDQTPMTTQTTEIKNAGEKSNLYVDVTSTVSVLLNH